MEPQEKDLTSENQTSENKTETPVENSSDPIPVITEMIGSKKQTFDHSVYIKLIITSLSLLLFFPLGLVLMYSWKLWTPWVRTIITGVIVLIVLTGGFILWRLGSTYQRLNNLVSNGDVIRNSINFTSNRSDFKPPTQEEYEKNLIVSANGVELEILNFSKEKYKDRLTQREKNYCAVSFSVKNIMTENTEISPLNNFNLLPDGYELELPLTNLTGLGEFVTQPAGVDYIGEGDFELKSGEKRQVFLPFECQEYKSSYIFQSEVNQFSPLIINGQIDFQPVRIKLAFE